MVALVAQTGKNKGNKNAALKPGEVGRIQWTQSLSGETLMRFVRYLKLDTENLDEKQIREIVVTRARGMFEEMIDSL